MGSYNTNLSINNSTFTGNKANYSTIEIGGTSSNTRLTSSIFWQDSAYEFDYWYPLKFSFDSFFNTITQLPYGADNKGNIITDPLFRAAPNPGPDGNWDAVEDDYGNLRLQAGSPCINTGDPDFVPRPGETDLDGHARVLCGRVDMGAYEFGIGDFDCNQTINLRDVAGLQTCFTGDSASPYTLFPLLNALRVLRAFVV